MPTEPDEGRTVPEPDATPPTEPGAAPVTEPAAAVEAPDDPAGARPSSQVRRALLLTPIVAVVVGIAVVLANLPGGRPLPSAEALPSVPVVAVSPGYLVTVDELRRRGSLASRGEEPYASAAADLLDWADGAIDDPSHPTQPLVIVGTDNPFVDDARRAYGLGLAYGLTGEEHFAAAARRTIRAWMDTSLTTADTCPDNGGCHTSLIIGRAGAGFAFGADLIAESEAWTDDDRADLQTWMRNVLLPAASERPNNWGDAGTFLRVVAADYAGDREAFDRAIATWRSFIDLIEPDGRIPEEVRRGAAGISYTQEALQYKVAVALIAQRHGIDLWNYQGAMGGSLRAAIDRLADYWYRPEDWPDHPRPRVPSTGPLWEIAYAEWQDARWVGIIEDRRPYGDQGHSAIRWTTLTSGIPLDPLVAGGPSGSPAETASPSTGPSPTPGSATAPPEAQVPPITGLAVRLGSPLATSLPITVRWDDPPLRGVGIELQRSVDGGTWTALAVGAGDHATSDTLRIGRRQAYRIRAVVGTVAGPWAMIDDVLAARIEPSSRTVDLSGSWKRVSFGDYSGDTALSTDAARATMTWRGTTHAVAIVGPTGPTRARLVVFVDGAREATVELYSARYTARTSLFSTFGGSAAEHEIRLVAEPAGGRRTVAIDDLVTLSWRVSAPPGSAP